MNKMIGPWAFILGLVIAIIAGFLGPMDSMYALVIAVLGIIVGILNVSDKEVNLFLLSGIGFLLGASSLIPVVTGVFGVVSGDLAGWIVSILNYVIVFVSPAIAIVGIKALYDISQN
ncbi:MAG: hypothetical protein V1834_03360 [Candidatus Micrarchaeota archaeon]